MGYMDQLHVEGLEGLEDSELVTVNGGVTKTEVAGVIIGVITTWGWIAAVCLL